MLRKSDNARLAAKMQGSRANQAFPQQRTGESFARVQSRTNLLSREIADALRHEMVAQIVIRSELARAYPDVTELLRGATDPVPFGEVAGKSGARIERVTIGHRRYVIKHLDLSQDWTLRASGCLPGAPLVLCERGILARLPDCINQPIVGAAPEGGPGTGRPGGCAVLMHDVTPWLVPVTDELVPLGQHVQFLGAFDIDLGNVLGQRREPGVMQSPSRRRRGSSPPSPGWR